MLSKLIVILALILILYSLGSGLYYLLMDRGKTNRVVKALTWRIGLSLALFIFLFVAFYCGWLTPHAV